MEPKEERRMFSRWPWELIQAAMTLSALCWPMAMFSPRQEEDTVCQALPSGRVWLNFLTIS